tara:strand:+ start:7496 stop:8761 length:1266 start_codon:yes stop_codon:yes gene_type:complete
MYKFKVHNFVPTKGNQDFFVKDQTSKNYKSTAPAVPSTSTQTATSLAPFGESSSENSNSENNQQHITYYNTKNMLVKQPNSNPSYGALSAWQGIRTMETDNTYLICGTTAPNPNAGYGLIFQGNISCTNGHTYYLNVPNSLSSSVYGPNYDTNTGLYGFVGSYMNPSDENIYGFYYNGYLNNNELVNAENYKYPRVNKKYDVTFVHSTMGEIMVGNCGNTGSSVSAIENSIVSFLYFTKSNMNNYIEIKFPNSVSTTTYGVWYNGNNKYTLVGGYSLNKNMKISDVYRNGVPGPFGNGFVCTFDALTQTFSNWTTLDGLPNNNNLETHIEGISKMSNGSDIYTLSLDTINTNLKTRTSYYATMTMDKNGDYIINKNYIPIEYPGNNNEIINNASSNSVADNNLVGLYISPKGNVPFQCKIN